MNNKFKTNTSILLVAVAFTFSASLALAGGSTLDLIKNHIIVRTTENVERNNDGDVTSISTVKSSKISVAQTLNEKKQRNKHGELVVVSKTQRTDIQDTLGGRVTIEEGTINGQESMVVKSITKVKKTPAGSITTKKTRNSSGSLVLTSRVTVSKDPSGVATTVIEAPDKDGNMVVKRTTTSF